ncbi:MAG: DUF4920 domain-containing protein [Ignavibacteria bacterium]|nr:DUF4920 domain-containing protein [Ignavibacteria bacterium]
MAYLAGSRLLGVGIAVCCVAVLLVAGCSKRDFVGVRPNTDAEMLTVSQAKQDQFLNKLVVVKGDVLSVCQDEGCWMVVTDGRTAMRVTFEAGGFTVPINLVGGVIMEGTLKSAFVTEQEGKAIVKSTLGTDAEVDSITGNRRIPMFTATGVIFLGDN